MTPITKEDAEARVQRGAAALDRGCPGWFHRINLSILDMRKCDRCIIGQLTGHYSREDAQSVGIPADDVIWHGVALAETEDRGRGFNGLSMAWQPIVKAWKNAILSRRASSR